MPIDQSVSRRGRKQKLLLISRNSKFYPTKTKKKSRMLRIGNERVNGIINIYLD